MATAAASVSRIVHEACCLDVRALKPGNVSVYAPGHRMTATDFVLSADAVAEVIARPGLSVGQRIERSIAATIEAVGCNTNLGIVLLLAPLVHAILPAEGNGNLRERLHHVLQRLDVADAGLAYIAIRMAHPAGLGRAPSQDVETAPTVTLLAAMTMAADRDRIARQYQNGFEDVFAIGVAALRDATDLGWPPAAAAVCCYLAFLSRFHDSHILRKFGADRAEEVRREAAVVESRVKACDNLGSAVPILLKMDNKLKAGGVNPGTSADLTIASLAAWRFITLQQSAKNPCLQRSTP